MRLIVLLMLAACASDPTSNQNAEISWSFNYRDWSKPNCADTGVTCPVPDTSTCKCDDVRGCDNAAAGNPGPDYDRVASVEIVLDDPAGVLPIYRESFDCSRGSADIKGLVAQTYKLDMTAKNAAGRVMYREHVEAFDLSSLRVETIELDAAVGELQFSPSFPDPDFYECPAGVTHVRWVVHDPVAVADVASGEAPCGDQFGVYELFLRNIPSFPHEDPDLAIPVNYDVIVEATDATGSGLYCSSPPYDRIVFPGRTNLRGDEPLTAGACP